MPQGFAAVPVGKLGAGQLGHGGSGGDYTVISLKQLASVSATPGGLHRTSCVIL